MTNPSRSLSNGRLARSGLVVARRERAHRAEAADAHRRDRGFRSTRDHHVGRVPLDDLVRVADGVRRRRAGGARRGVGPLGAEADRNLPRREVDDGRRNEERRDAPRAAVEIRLVLALDRAEPADAGRDEHADTRRVRGRDLQARVVHGELRCRNGVLDEDVHLLDIFLLDELQRIEPLHLARDLCREVRHVEARDGRNSALSAEKGGPVRLVANAQRGHQPDARDDHSPAHSASTAVRCGRSRGCPATSCSSRAPRCTRRLPSRG